MTADRQQPLTLIRYQDLRHHLERIAHVLLTSSDRSDDEELALTITLQFLQSHCHACAAPLNLNKPHLSSGWLCERCHRRSPWARN